jgi:hypothetical protein
VSQCLLSRNSLTGRAQDVARDINRILDDPLVEPPQNVRRSLYALKQIGPDPKPKSDPAGILFFGGLTTMHLDEAPLGSALDVPERTSQPRGGNPMIVGQRLNALLSDQSSPQRDSKDTEG